MKFTWILIGVLAIGFCKADSDKSNQQYVGEWNYTYSPHGSNSSLCIKLRSGIRLDITYNTTQNGTKTKQIYVNENVTVDGSDSQCDDAMTDANETLAMKFNDDDILRFFFTRDPDITGDSKGKKWLLYKVEFQYKRLNSTFPDIKDENTTAVLSNNASLSGIYTSTGRSFSCSTTGAIQINKDFKMAFSHLQVQSFGTEDKFQPADHCATDQEETDLIPIIIGAALAALVIIVLIVYLIRRARAKTPAYDNMK